MAYDWDCAAAEKEYARAIELNANYATAHHWYSHCLVIMGRFPEGIGEIQQAHELDPLSMTINDFWALALYYSRDYAQAVAQFRAMADLDPSARSAASVVRTCRRLRTAGGLRSRARSMAQHVIVVRESSGRGCACECIRQCRTGGLLEEANRTCTAATFYSTA